MKLALAIVAALSLSMPALAAAITAADVPRTTVRSTAALARLVAHTGIAVQWNWGARPGKLTVEANDGWLSLRGEQHDAHGGKLNLDGNVRTLDEKQFTFRGRIVIHDAEANVDCVRDGDYAFRIMGARKFWRMKEQVVHCEGREDLTDYVDIYF